MIFGRSLATKARFEFQDFQFLTYVLTATQKPPNNTVALQGSGLGVMVSGHEPAPKVRSRVQGLGFGVLGFRVFRV